MRTSLVEAAIVDDEEGAGVEPIALKVLNYGLQFHQLPE